MHAAIGIDLLGAVGDDLVGVHVGRGAGTGLVGIDWKVFVVLSFEDFAGHFFNQGGLGGINDTEFAIGACGGQFDEAVGMNHQGINRAVGYRKVKDCALGGGSVEGFNWDGHFSHGIAFDACFGHGSRVVNPDCRVQTESSRISKWEATDQALAHPARLPPRRLGTNGLSMRILPSLLIFFCTFSPVAVLAEESPWLDTYEAGLKRATEQKKDLLVSFMGSDWCEQCKILKETVLSKEDFISGVSANFVLVELDSPQQKPEISERNEPVLTQYGVRNLPVLVTADSTGRPYGEVRFQQNWKVDDYLKAIADQSGKKATREEARAELKSATDDEARREALEKLLTAVPQTSIAHLYTEEFNELRKVSKDKSPLVLEVASKERVEKLQRELQTLTGQRRYDEVVTLCETFLAHDNLSDGERQMGLTFKYYSQMELRKFDQAVDTAEALLKVDPQSPIGRQAVSLMKRAQSALASAEKPKPVVPVKPATEGPMIGEEKGSSPEVAKTEAIKPTTARHKQTLIELEKVHADLAAAEMALAQAEAELAAAREAHEKAHKAEVAARKMAEKKSEIEASKEEEALDKPATGASQIEQFEKNAAALRKQAEELRKNAQKLQQANEE